MFTMGIDWRHDVYDIKYAYRKPAKSAIGFFHCRLKKITYVSSQVEAKTKEVLLDGMSIDGVKADGSVEVFFPGACPQKKHLAHYGQDAPMTIRQFL